MRYRKLTKVGVHGSPQQADERPPCQKTGSPSRRDEEQVPPGNKRVCASAVNSRINQRPIKRIRERKKPTIGPEKERRKVRNYAEEAAPVTGNARGAKNQHKSLDEIYGRKHQGALR